MELFRDNETNNLNGTYIVKQSATVRGEPVGCLQAWPRIWTQDYWEPIQLLPFRAGTRGLQITSPAL